jgi:hypothetical protein
MIMYRYKNPEHTVVQTLDKRWSGLRTALPDTVLETDIEPYVAPPAPTDTQRIDAVFPQTDTGRVIFEAFFELTNDVRALKGQTPITKTQLKTWFQSKLASLA